MRHEQIATGNNLTEFDIAAVWPGNAPFAPMPLPDLPRLGDPDGYRAAPAAPDVPVAIGRLIVAAYSALIAAFALTAAGSRESIFMISISALFVVIFFTVPRLMLGVEPKGAIRPSFSRFMESGMDTFTGRSSGQAALVQILIVPIFLTGGVLAMAIAAAIIF
jgi:hypothetical protein